jgi:hypothetical protein
LLPTFSFDPEGIGAGGLGADGSAAGKFASREFGAGAEFKLAEAKLNGVEADELP